MRKRGLFSLMQDCEAYHPNRKAIRKYKNSKNEEVIITKVEDNGTVVAEDEPVATASEFYDFGEAVSLSYDREEAEHYAQQHSYDDLFSDDLDYEVESFEHHAKKEKQKDKKEAEETIIINNPNPAPLPVIPPDPKPLPVFPPSAKPMPVMPGETDKETVPMNEDDNFEADLKAILSGQKKYDQGQKKLISAQEEGGPRRAKRRPPEEEPMKDEHAIFDKIAQSMQLAKTYDLGSINLEQRFDNFDKEMEEKEALLSKKKSSVVKQKSEQPQAIEAKSLGVDTTDFLDDLDKMSGQTAYVGAFSNDIPLSPKTGGRSIGEDTLEIGDIILSTTNDPEISGNIRKVTRSEVSHAAIYVGNGNVIEAIESGVLERSLETAMADDSVTVAFRHQYMTPEKAEIIRDFLTEKRKAKTGFDRYAVIRNLPIQMITSACAVLAPALRDKCRNFAGRIFLGTETNNEFYCSELVFAAFEAAGLQLANTSPHWTSAEDLVQLSYNGTLRYVGHLKTTNI
ncbi:MAG: hypothetical protein AAF599_02980 [Bacteroidota bacterium]